MILWVLTQSFRWLPVSVSLVLITKASDKLELMRSSETMLITCKTTQCYSLEDQGRHIHLNDNLKLQYISVFTMAHYLFLTWTRWMQSTASHRISLISILMLSSHLHLDLSSLYFRLSNRNLLYAADEQTHPCQAQDTPRPTMPSQSAGQPMPRKPHYLHSPAAWALARLSMGSASNWLCRCVALVMGRARNEVGVDWCCMV